MDTISLFTLCSTMSYMRRIWWVGAGGDPLEFHNDVWIQISYWGNLPWMYNPIWTLPMDANRTDHVNCDNWFQAPSPSAPTATVPLNDLNTMIYVWKDIVYFLLQFTLCVMKMAAL